MATHLGGDDQIVPLPTILANGLTHDYNDQLWATL